MSRPADTARRVAMGEAGYPDRLRRLAPDAPEWVDLHGNVRLLDEPTLAVFCSVHVPGRAVIEAFDLARGLAASSATLIGGFQSPVEREVLEYALRGSAAAIVCPARGLARMKLPQRWERAVDESRLLLLSTLPARFRRPTARTAALRNRVAAALASDLLILHATAGGRLSRLAAEAAGWGVALHCLDHPANDDLRVLGAVPLRRWPSRDGSAQSAPSLRPQGVHILPLREGGPAPPGISAEPRCQDSKGC
jgi:predicted Rossmann fold nucleotide-binding protein DprA/Smf involved in DNA uptake